MIDSLKSDLQSMRSEVDSKRREITQLEQLRQEIAIWINWGRQLLLEVAGPRAALIPLEDIRVLIEEACLSSVGHRLFTSKLAMLREEKKLFTNPRLNERTVLVAGGAREKLVSIRPVIVAILALRRVQRMSGLLPVLFALSPNTTEIDFRIRGPEVSSLASFP
jgi:hypothetical protein